MSGNDFDAEKILALSGDALVHGVVVLPRTGMEIPYPNCLVVEPFRDPAWGDELLATIEHFVAVEHPSGFPWNITRVNENTLVLKDAIQEALAYAQRNDVPVILVNHDDLSTADERRQTDTTAINIRVPERRG